MNLRQERLLSRRSQLGRERFKCWNAWCSWHRQRHERGRYRCVALSLFTDPAVHHVRVQAMRQGHTTDAGPRLGTQGKYLCLELLAVFTPAWAVLIQRLFHRLHDPPSWGRCPLHAGSSRWDRRALTVNGDAELIYALEARDGRGRLLAEGGLDRAAVARAVLDIMEGSEQAFKRRSEKYHF